MLNSIKGSSVFNHLNDISVATAEAEALAGVGIDIGSDYAMELGFDELEVR